MHLFHRVLSTRYAVLVALSLILVLPASAQVALTQVPLSDPVYSSVHLSGDPISLTQNYDPYFVNVGTIACSSLNTGFTSVNRYLRVFILSEAGITSPVTFDSAATGISPDDLSNVGSVETIINVYTMQGGVDLWTSFSYNDLTLLSSTSLTVHDEDELGIYSIDLENPVLLLPTDTLVVELAIPDGSVENGGFSLRPGANEAGATQPFYVSSESCEIIDPYNIDQLGDFDAPDWVLVVNGSTTTVNAEDGTVVQRVSLGQNFPNPVVSGATSIPFTLGVARDVSVTVYDALGREVAATTAAFTAGEQSVQIDTRALPNGVYFYRINAGETTQTGNMVVMQ